MKSNLFFDLFISLLPIGCKIGEVSFIENEMGASVDEERSGKSSRGNGSQGYRPPSPNIEELKERLEVYQHREILLMSALEDREAKLALLEREKMSLPSKSETSSKQQEEQIATLTRLYCEAENNASRGYIHILESIGKVMHGLAMIHSRAPNLEESAKSLQVLLRDYLRSISVLQSLPIGITEEVRSSIMELTAQISSVCETLSSPSASSLSERRDKEITNEMERLALELGKLKNEQREQKSQLSTTQICEAITTAFLNTPIQFPSAKIVTALYNLEERLSRAVWAAQRAKQAFVSPSQVAYDAVNTIQSRVLSVYNHEHHRR